MRKKKKAECQHCGVVFETVNDSPKFCSRSCAASDRNKKRIITDDQKRKTSESLKRYWQTQERKKPECQNRVEKRIHRHVYDYDGYVILCFDGKVIREHRHIMEQAIGRKLSTDEIVHHKDGNRLNNSLDNLEILSRSDHARMHSSTGISYVELICDFCGNKFRRDMRQVNAKLKNGQNRFFCKRSCIGKACGAGRLRSE